MLISPANSLLWTFFLPVCLSQFNLSSLEAALLFFPNYFHYYFFCIPDFVSAGFWCHRLYTMIKTMTKMIILSQDTELYSIFVAVPRR